VKFLKVTQLLLLVIVISATTSVNGQFTISRECTNITPVFTSENVNDCLLIVDIFYAQGRAF